MKLNWAERLVVNNPFRMFLQQMEIYWQKNKTRLKKDSVVLEIGCGRGAGARLIMNNFQPACLHTMDLDIKMVRMAKKYLSDKERGKINLQTGDATKLPFKPRAFDAVFGFGFLHHVPDWRKALDEIARVLKPGGIYFVEELYPSLYQNIITKRILLHPEDDRFTGLDLRESMKERNLPIIESIENKMLGIVGLAIRI